MTELLGVTIDSNVAELAAGIVVARGCTTTSAPAALVDELRAAIEEAKVRDRADTEAVTRAVRDLLRHGKYKPTGRGKPASEYLQKAAVEDRFPAINNLVDVNNLVSLRSMLPISLVDLARAEADHFLLRRGRPGESYVFNAAGQTIDLQDLLLVARAFDDRACANPVKDSMATKLNDDSTDVMAVLYAPHALRERLEAAADAFARALRSHAGATDVATTITVAG